MTKLGKILIGLAPAIEMLAQSNAVPAPWAPWVSFLAVAVGIVGGALGVNTPVKPGLPK